MANPPLHLTQLYLKECLDYDPSTGSFTWKERPISHFRATQNRAAEHARSLWNARYANQRAGRINRGYIQVAICETRFMAHHLAWLFVHGSLPAEFIDHINNDPSDNRISNLRQATPLENARNRRRRRDNLSGVKGVGWHKAARKWSAAIYHNGKRIHLGTFESLDDAAASYRSAAIKYHGQFVRFE